MSSPFLAMPEFRNFQFSNLRVNHFSLLVKVDEIHPRKPLIGFSLTNVTGTYSSIVLVNIRNAVIRNVKVTEYTEPLMIGIYNVAGTRLARAANIDPARLPKVPEPIPAPATPYQLH